MVGVCCCIGPCVDYYLRVIWGSCVTPASPRVFMITSRSFHMCALISYRLMCVCAKEVNELLKGHISSSIDLPPLFFIPPYLDPVCIFSPRGRLLLVPNKLEKCTWHFHPLDGSRERRKNINLMIDNKITNAAHVCVSI